MGPQKSPQKRSKILQSPPPKKFTRWRPCMPYVVSFYLPPIQVKTYQHESETSQHESIQVRHEPKQVWPESLRFLHVSTRARHYSTQVLHEADTSQQKSKRVWGKSRSGKIERIWLNQGPNAIYHWCFLKNIYGRLHLSRIQVYFSYLLPVTSSSITFY